MQALPMIAKVRMSQQRIREWYDHFDGNVFVSFSGGKDSTVLAHLVHEWYPDVPLVFCNTGLEYPEIQDFARRMGAEFIRPKMSFSEVISTYGYPIISKENAEAIHYARRIRNSEGGGTTTVHHRREINGQRCDTLWPSGVSCRGSGNSVGGVQGALATRPTDGEQTSAAIGTNGTSMYQGRTGWRRATLTGKPLCKIEGGVQHPPAGAHENATEQPLRRNHSGGGIEQTGRTGEGEPSPG